MSGIARSDLRRRRANRERVEALLAGPVELIPFAEEDAPKQVHPSGNADGGRLGAQRCLCRDLARGAAPPGGVRRASGDQMAHGEGRASMPGQVAR